MREQKLFLVSKHVDFELSPPAMHLNALNAIRLIYGALRTNPSCYCDSLG